MRTPEEKREAQKIASAKFAANNPEKVKASNKRWRLNNPTWQIEWRKNNPELEKEIQKRANAKASRKEYLRLWREANPEKVIAARKKTALKDAGKRQKRFRKNNVLKVRETAKIRRHNRKARTRISGGVISEGLVSILLKEQGNKCPYCFGDLTKIGYHMDHYFPISKGGSNEDWNIQLTCGSCNKHKWNKHPMKFLAEVFSPASLAP